MCYGFGEKIPCRRLGFLSADTLTCEIKMPDLSECDVWALRICSRCYTAEIVTPKMAPAAAGSAAGAEEGGGGFGDRAGRGSPV